MSDPQDEINAALILLILVAQILVARYALTEGD